MGCVLLLLLSVRGVSFDSGIVPHFDMVEVNHKIACDGTTEFVQVLAWTWSPDYSRYHCEGYKIIQSYRRTPRGVRFLKSFNSRVWEEVNGDIVKISYTENDPERDNTRYYPTDCRQWR